MAMIEVGAGARGVAIAGPTASGKSALALDLARRHGGVVINADSMQVYRDLAVLTARPEAADLAAAPHRLYGHVDGARAHSAAIWALQAQAEIQVARAAGALPILVGGTGLYFRSLFKGLAAVPPVPVEIRERWRDAASRIDSSALHAELARRDPAMAERLRPSDPQRIVRALEVIDATGRSLADWQAAATDPIEDETGWARVVLTPDRAALRDRIDRRFQAMVGEGALDEARALLGRGLDPALPVMKAIGVAELGAHLAGTLSLEEAIARAVTATRAYAKRQETWFRHQMGGGWSRTS